MHLTHDQAETFRRDGVLPLGRVLTPEQVGAAREHIEQLIATNKTDRPESEPGKFLIRRLNASKFDPWFATLVRSDPVLDAAESVLGPNVQYFQDNVFYKPASVGGATPFHQDNIWWHSDPPNMVTIWIALDDVDRENGAVQYSRGSNARLIDHTLPVTDPTGIKFNVIDPAHVDRATLVSYDLPAGHAVMHHCLTIHGAPANASQRPRRGYTIHLMQAGLLNVPESDHPVLRGRMPVKSQVA